jgi:alpha-beta hydrolase superfamily lysophospholipase
VSTEEQTKHRAALLRAMPMTRMLDYGMDYWDAATLNIAPAWEPWHVVASALAESQLARAAEAAARRNNETAVACYRSATAALIFAQLEFNADTVVKHELYERLGQSYDAAAALDVQLHTKKLSIPFGSSHCSGWLVQDASMRPGPIVIVVGGQSGWGPAYHRQAEALARRGLTAVLLEAPGQGESRMLGGLHLKGDAHQAFSSTLDIVSEITGYDGRAGVWGNSLGGLIAANVAVHDNRFGACCVNGAATNPTPSPFRTAIEQSQALFGVDTIERTAIAFRELWLDPAVDHMSAALLVLHGGADPLIRLDQQKVFLNLSSDSTLRIWQDGEHTIYNHSAERTDFVSDWFRSHLAS